MHRWLEVVVLEDKMDRLMAIAGTHFRLVQLGIAFEIWFVVLLDMTKRAAAERLQEALAEKGSGQKSKARSEEGLWSPIGALLQILHVHHTVQDDGGTEEGEGAEEPTWKPLQLQGTSRTKAAKRERIAEAAQEHRKQALKQTSRTTVRTRLAHQQVPDDYVDVTNAEVPSWGAEALAVGVQDPPRMPPGFLVGVGLCFCGWHRYARQQGHSKHCTEWAVQAIHL